MIQRFAVAALVAAVGASAQATEFNKDALKAMQQQGHQIVEESESRRFKAQGDLCLDTSDEGLLVKTCSDADSQKWRLDDQQRLIAHSGQCVAGAKVRECGDENAQKWTLDDEKRLANANQRCLQVQGGAPQSGAKVITAPCGDVVAQIWQ